MPNISPEEIFNFLSAMARFDASDLYLTIGKAPTLRGKHGFSQISDIVLSPANMREILVALLNRRQLREFEQHMELNTAVDMKEQGRFRINVLQQKHSPAIVIRRIDAQIPKIQNLGLPPIFKDLALERRGLVLITGMTGSGKSTTLASMIDYRNEISEGHIITIEDPIEFFHEHKKSVITQREVGVDTKSYAVAMKNTLRQRPDVILVGEIRDREVMEQALAISETGHLCLATLHTSNAYQSIERIVNFFPEEMEQQVRLNLSLNLKGIISQRLLSGRNRKLVPAVEIMLNQGLVRELILKGEVGKIRDVIGQNTSSGMCTFDQSLEILYKNGEITEETAMINADKPSEMKIRLRNVKFSGDEDGGGQLSGMDTSIISLND